MPQIELKILYTSVAVSDDAQLWTSSSSLADQTAQKDNVKILPGFTYLGSLVIWMTEDTSSEDNSTSIKLSNMYALCMTSGKMYDLVIYNTWVPYFAAVKKLKTLKTKDKQGNEVCPRSRGLE